MRVLISYKSIHYDQNKQGPITSFPHLAQFLAFEHHIFALAWPYKKNMQRDPSLASDFL